MQTGQVVDVDRKVKKDGTPYQRVNVDLGGTRQWCSNFDYPDFAVNDTVQVEQKGRFWNVVGGQPSNGVQPTSQAAAPSPTSTSDLPLATYIEAAEYVAGEVGDPHLAATVFDKWATPGNLRKFADYANRQQTPSKAPPKSRLDQYQETVLQDDDDELPF